MKRRPFALALAALAVLHACAGEEPAPHPGFEDVLLQGGATTDSLAAFVHAMELQPPLPGGPELVFTWPANGEVIPEKRGDILTFCWELAPSARAPRPPRPGAAGMPWAALLEAAPAARSPGWTAPLAELLGPPRAAHAGPPPYEGMLTYAVFSTSDDPALVRVLTGNYDYNPTASEFQKMAAATQPITLRLVTAFVKADEPVASGPFTGIEMTFTISR